MFLKKSLIILVALSWVACLYASQSQSTITTNVTNKYAQPITVVFEAENCDGQYYACKNVCYEFDEINENQTVGYAQYDGTIEATEFSLTHEPCDGSSMDAKVNFSGVSDWQYIVNDGIAQIIPES